MTALRLLTRVETIAFGKTLGAHLRSGDVIALIGDLGAGKTTLAQGVALGLGITEPITSPTFALIHEYTARTPLFHLDPYRLDSGEDLLQIGFADYIERDGVLLIEWADRVKEILPPDRLTLHLSIDETNLPEDLDQDAARILVIEAGGDRSRALMASLLADSDIAPFRLPDARGEE